MTIYQQVGKGQYINHERADFAKLPVTGETKPISYNAEGKAVVSETALIQKKREKLTDQVAGLTLKGWVGRAKSR
jgi:hypothetical protein